MSQDKPKADKRIEATKSRLYGALGRLAEGRALSSDGKMTPASLAREAGVGRATVYRFPEFLEKLLQLKSGTNSATSLYDKNRKLEAEVRQLRSMERMELRQLRSLNDAYAQRIQVMSLALILLEEKIAARDKIIAEFQIKTQDRSLLSDFPQLIGRD